MPASSAFTTTARVRCKQNQANSKQKCFLCLDLFGGIGTFQRVTGEKNKNNFPASNSRYGLRSAGS
jgi:hypothetical protein